MGRPKVPAETQREILIECGHRCAVCGEGCPLEKAHIVPWRITKDHAAANLICLCANCHQRADLENWGEKTLREYKEKPWVIRRYAGDNNNDGDRGIRKIELSLSLALPEFKEKDARLLVYALAAFLDTSPKDVKILAVEDGSVKVSVGIPNQAMERLIEDYNGGGHKLRSYLYSFNFTEVKEQLVNKIGKSLPLERLSESGELSRVAEGSVWVPAFLLEEVIQDQFILRIEGNALAEVGILDRDELVVLRNNGPTAGKLVLFVVDGIATIGRYEGSSQTSVNIDLGGRADSRVVKVPAKTLSIEGIVLALMRRYTLEHSKNGREKDEPHV